MLGEPDEYMGRKTDGDSTGYDISASSSGHLIFSVDEPDNKFTALMWVERNPDVVLEDNQEYGARSKFIDVFGRDYENAKKRANVPYMTRKAKVLVIAMVIILSCVPVMSIMFSSTDTASVITTMSNPEMTSNVFAGGHIIIEQDSDSEGVFYTLSYVGSDSSCAWYIICNEDSAYVEENGQYVVRDYTYLGTGSDIEISSSVMHVGSYKLKLITENHTYADTVLINGDIDTVYNWTFVGQGGSSVSNTISISYDFCDYYEYYTDSEIGRNSYNQIAEFAVTDPVLSELVDSLETEYRSHYPSFNSDWYINYLLTFVQLCFNYPSWTDYPDLYEYGEYDYFAYPLETIFRDMGDCEDTAILSAAMFNYAGYNSAVTLLYSGSGDNITVHSTSAVCMENLVSNYNVTSAFTVGEITHNGVYYLCETTVTNQLAAGYVEHKYVDK